MNDLLTKFKWWEWILIAISCYIFVRLLFYAIFRGYHESKKHVEQEDKNYGNKLQKKNASEEKSSFKETRRKL